MLNLVIVLSVVFSASAETRKPVEFYPIKLMNDSLNCAIKDINSTCTATRETLAKHRQELCDLTKWPSVPTQRRTEARWWLITSQFDGSFQWNGDLVELDDGSCKDFLKDRLETPSFVACRRIQCKLIQFDDVEVKKTAFDAIADLQNSRINLERCVGNGEGMERWEERSCRDKISHSRNVVTDTKDALRRIARRANRYYRDFVGDISRCVAFRTYPFSFKDWYESCKFYRKPFPSERKDFSIVQLA